MPSPVPRRRRIAAGIIWCTGVLLAVMAIVVARPAWHLWRTARFDRDALDPLPPGYADDASRMNRTPVREVRTIPEDPRDAEAQLADLLAEARARGWKVSIAGARHSMGGHTIYPGGVVLDMLPLDHMELDTANETLDVGAGALWRDVLEYLDPRGRSVAVMQSNHSFSVGGSISVNCHGWQYGRPPIASTVRSFRLMRADGTIVRASRNENRELFSAVLGGYGLFGIILDAELEVVPNQRYRLDRRVVSTANLMGEWDAAVAERAGTAMVYGRLHVAAERFLDEALLYVLYLDPDPQAAIPAMHEPGLVEMRRHIFRGSADSEYGKRLRWRAEVEWQPAIGGNVFSRNQLLNEGVEVFQNRSAETTDILHEYFLPRSAWMAFIRRIRDIVPDHGGNLLNVTVRSVERDDDTLLRYADQRVVSLVMLFHQDRTAAGDARMEAMTREMIDAALELGGRYYLPYRLHATVDQFHRAYPQAGDFFALKRKYDPDGLFQNQFYVKYGGVADVGQEAN